MVQFPLAFSVKGSNITQVVKYSETCVFCGAPSLTQEDVFPLWLQHTYDLYNKRINLLDNSSIPYRQLKISACAECNNETLSKIEQRIKKQSASVIEYYLWSLKIYIGILYKESLLISHKYRSNANIVDKKSIGSDLGIAKSIFNVWKNKGSFYPDPPGSVIRVPRTGDNRYFDYCDIPIIPILGIALPNEFVFSLPFDKGRAMNRIDITRFPKSIDDTIFRFFVAEMGYDEARWEAGFSSLTVDNKVLISPGSLHLNQPRSFNKNEFKKLLKAVGLNGESKAGKKWKISKA